MVAQKSRSPEGPWSDRAVFHEALQNFFTSFVDLPLSLVTELKGEQRWSSLVQSQLSPDLVHYDAYIGRLEARRRYHLPHLAQVRRTGLPVVGEYCGSHDAFVPVFHKGRVEGVLVSGPFFKALPDAVRLRANFKALSGLKPASEAGLLLEYARIALSTPVLEPPVLKGYLDALAAVGRYLSGSSSGNQTEALLKRLQNEVFAPLFPYRSFRFVAGRRDRRFWTFNIQPRLAPWDRVELGLTRHPSLALAVTLLREPSSAASELEDLASNAALDLHCFHWARKQPDCIAGRLDNAGAYILSSPVPRSPAVRTRQRVTELAQALATDLRRSFNRPVAIGVGGISAPPELLPESMHEAAVALQLCARSNKSLIFFEDQALAAEQSGPARLLGRLEDLRQAYSRALPEESSLAADQFVADVLLQTRLSAEGMRTHFNYAFAALQESLRRRALLPPHRLDQFQKQWLGRLEAEATPYGLMTAFRDMLQAFLGLITAPGEGDRLLRLDQARRYVDQHCLEPISIRDAAKIGGFSPSRFSRLFRRAVGTGFGDYLLRRRLEHAKHLLLHSQLPIQQVAVEAGFSSLSYFSQAFKKSLSLSPTEFRSTGRDEPARTKK